MKKISVTLILLISIFEMVSIAQTRLVLDPQTHFGVVNDMAFTNDGQYLISVSDDKTIRVWDVANKLLDRTLRTFAGEGPQGAIYASALSPEGRFLALGGYFPENEIRIIDIKKVSEVVTLKGHSNVITSLEFTKDGLHLASADVLGVINIWDIVFEEGKIIGKINNTLKGHEAQVYDLSWSPSGKQLVSASYDGTLKLWDVTGAKPAVDMRMHIDKVYSCSFSPDGEWIISGGNKGKVIVWNNKGTFKRYLASIDKPINDISIFRNEIIISAKQGFHYSLANSAVKEVLPVKFSSVSASAISNNGLVALAGGTMGNIILYDITTNDPVQVYKSGASLPKNIAFSESGILAFDYDGSGTSKGFDLESLKYVWEVNKEHVYNKEMHNQDGYMLAAVDKYTLSTGFKGKVEMNPRTDGRIRSYSIIDDETIAIGGDYSLKLYSRDGVLKGEMGGFNGAITSIAAANNKIAAICSDQTIKVWNVQTTELLVSIYLAPKDEWICWTPQGYYEASSGGEKYMGWQEDKSPEQLSAFYKSSVFASKFHRPEMVKQTLTLGSFEMAKEKVKVMEVPDQKQIVKDAPEIVWLSPELVSTTIENGSVSIKALVKSDSEIKMVKILVNGRPTSATRGVFITKTIGEHDLLIEQKLTLNHEVNEIRIFIANQDTKYVSEKRVYQLTNPLITGKRSLDVINYSDRPDLYVLSIGVSEYSNEAYNLNYADDDAMAIANVFAELGTGVYKEVNVTRLMNKEASKETILKSFEALRANALAKDMVLIFIASHGINDEGQFYIIPHDGDLQDVPQSLVSWESIAGLLGDLPSRVLVFVDACKSGQLGVNLTNSYADNTEAVRTTASDQNGVVIMAASTGHETAQESSEWEHGAFTLSILEGLKNGKADIKPDGTIFLRELDFYVSERTVELTNNAQHPTTQKPSTISRFSVINLNK